MTVRDAGGEQIGTPAPVREVDQVMDEVVDEVVGEDGSDD